ncbi:MAG: ATPase [Gammaproteobacteria bacterium]|nr:ATPase [Gammaproteobacteria bacterium]
MAQRPDPHPNPFVYGRILSVSDAACKRADYEEAILETARNKGRLALVGDRRQGKSSLIERTLAVHGFPVLRWDFHKILSLDDLVRRAAEDLDTFVRDLSPVARRITPWLREIGVGIKEIRLSYHGASATLSLGAPTDHLKRLLGYLAQVSARRPFSLFIDELQDIKDRLEEREGDAVLGLLRGELQRLKIPCFFAGSSRDSFRGLFTNETSPFFESARLLEVQPVPPDQFSHYLVAQFARGGYTLAREAAEVILNIGGSSPNDVQHLAHEVWNFSVRKTVSAQEIDLALAKILHDLSPMGEAWLALLTRRQTRALLATALFDHLGASTEEFLRVAGLENRGAISGALRPCISGSDPIVEKIGARYRVRSRYLRLWLATQRHLAQELIPSLRDETRYQTALRYVCPTLPDDLRLGIDPA